MPAASSASLVDVTTCALCGGGSYTAAFDDPPYQVRRCSSCGLVWVSPRHSEDGLADLYGSASYWRSDSPKTQGYADYRADERLYLKTFERRSDFVVRHAPPPARVLDVGCAAGFFMKVLAGRGYDVHGVELSPEIARHAIDQLGFDVHVGTIETSTYEASSFDLITMWDVVEHVPDPKSLLQRAHELLRPDGTLILETQNVDSRFARLLGPKWHHYKHEEHLYHFNRSTISGLLRDTGYEAQLITPRFGGKYVSLSFVSERAARLHPALSTALKPLNVVGGASLYVNLMDEMVVVARPVVA